MPDTVIRVENLGKRYRIGAALRRPRSAREAAVQFARSPFKYLQRALTPPSEEEILWALRNISFEVKRGEVIGIIGRNGAGKSTLLKILSRITEPTEGRAELHGRVGSLLEVGVGFNPELTGRENIYLNGAILGMKKAETARKFDEIVAFSEVERFLDTPVKHYSSGMYVRLAFAVAAHLEPEILVVDEVLAVGDAEFQKKCLGKMGDVAKGGRTVLFVSHNMGAVTQLCGTVIVLNKGNMVTQGPAASAVKSYLYPAGSRSAARKWDPSDAPGDEWIRLLGVRVRQDGAQCDVIDTQGPFEIEVETEILKATREMVVGLRVCTSWGIVALHTADVADALRAGARPGRKVFSCRIPARALKSGQYSLHVGANIPYVRTCFFVEGAIGWRVEDTSSQAARYPAGAWEGVLSPTFAEWGLSEMQVPEGQDAQTPKAKAT